VSSSKKENGSKKELPIIKCFCGAKILLVSNVKLMSKAIDTHVEKHKRKVKDPAEAEKESDKVSEYLIMQLFEKVSKE